MIPQDMLTAASRAGWEQGLRILQGYRLAPTDAAHVARLLTYMAPPRDTLWLDLGCGFGEVARLMRELRPDLRFILVNNNRFQLDRVPGEFRTLDADMAAVPLDDGCADGCMFLYSLCHAESFHTVLREAARLTAPGGALFVFDYQRLGGTNALMHQRLYAWALYGEQMQDELAAAGWRLALRDYPDGDDSLFRSLFASEAEYELIFRDLVPVIIKAVRA
jgi:SAM-dependent methyltransferase